MPLLYHISISQAIKHAVNNTVNTDECVCVCVIYIFRRINTVSRVTVNCVVCMTVGITSRIPKEIRLQR